MDFDFNRNALARLLLKHNTSKRVFEKSFTCTDYRRVMRIKNDVDKLYDTDLTDAAWSLIAPILPAARSGGRPRKTNLRAVLNAVFYLLRTGCQWRLLPREFPSWNTVYHYFRSWKNDGVWTCLQRSMYQQVRRQAGRAICPSVLIMDGQSVKTTERGGIRGFDAHKRVKGRKRHIVVDIFGLLIACRVEPADISDRKAAVQLPGGLAPLFPNIRTVIADAGHQSIKLARYQLRQEGWRLQIVRRRQRAFKITGLTWIVERSFAWLCRNRRLSKDYKYGGQSSETLIEIASTRLLLNRLART
jgi:putative transposase